MAEGPRTLDEVMALVRGPLGVEMDKFPLKFAVAAYFGAPPRPDMPATVSSGSASLLRLNGKAFALTCSHVLDVYRERLAVGHCIFQLHNCKLDPLTQLEAEDKTLDYALIGLTEAQAVALVMSEGPFGGKFFVTPHRWPPGKVKEGEFVAFGGFPGQLRRALSFDRISFGSYSSGSCRVVAAHPDYFVCQFEREHWISHGDEPEPGTIRGLSGGPAFAIRCHPGQLITYEFVGHVYEFSEDYELLYVRLASVLPI